MPDGAGVRDDLELEVPGGHDVVGRVIADDVDEHRPGRGAGAHGQRRARRIARGQDDAGPALPASRPRRAKDRISFFILRAFSKGGNLRVNHEGAPSIPVDSIGPGREGARSVRPLSFGSVVYAVSFGEVDCFCVRAGPAIVLDSRARRWRRLREITWVDGPERGVYQHRVLRTIDAAVLLAATPSMPPIATARCCVTAGGNTVPILGR